MKVINVHPGILEIPPKSWGAIEKVIWNYHLELQKLNINSEILYLNDIQNSCESVVHIHVTNLANMAHSRGIEYFFSLHDHHVLFEYGYDDYVLETRTAIENSIMTIIHTPEFFTNPRFSDLSHKFIYIQHGADPNIYKNLNLDKTGDLLCVASNGLIGFKNFDRKGFLLASQVADHLNLNLTICCPSNTKNFLDNYNLSNKKNVTILYDLGEAELIEQYNLHKIFLHPSILEAGHPNLTLAEAHMCGMDIVGSYKGTVEIPNMVIVNDLLPISYTTAILAVLNKQQKYPISKELQWETIIKKIVGIYKKYSNTNKRFIDTLLESYNNINSIIHRRLDPNKINITFDRVPKIETSGPDVIEYVVSFIGVDENNLEHSVYTSNINNNMWTRPTDVYYNNWKVNVEVPSDGFKQTVLDTGFTFDKWCAIVSTYTNKSDVINKTKKTIDNIKENIKIPVICCDHYEYQKQLSNADEYVLDKNNILTYQSYYKYAFSTVGNKRVTLDLHSSGNGKYHGPAVYQNYYNGIKKAKELGYVYAVLTNFDMVFSKNDINKIKMDMNTVMYNNLDGMVLHAIDLEGHTYKTVFFMIKIDSFLEYFNEIFNEDDYNNMMITHGSESNGLENIFYHVLKYNNRLLVRESSESQYFESSMCFTNSQTDYFSAIFDKEKDIVWVYVKRANKNVTPYDILVNVYSPATGKSIMSWRFNIETEFNTLLPINVTDISIPFTIELITFDTLETQTIVVDNVDELIKNGKVENI
jgi:glycosyltransferase involved in cell wall biosynthesis